MEGAIKKKNEKGIQDGENMLALFICKTFWGSINSQDIFWEEKKVKKEKKEWLV